jgi:polar amino acid transport system substrate-binding protein
MTPSLRLALPVALALQCAPAYCAPPHLYIATEISPPSSLVDNGQITGYTTEKVREIMKRTGTTYDIELLPFKRAMLSVQTRPDTCIYSLTRLPERETLFKWVGPTHSSDWTLFGRAGKNYQVRTLEDARKYHIGAYFGDVRGETLTAMGFTVETVRERLSNPRKLLADRLDLWVSSRQMGGSLIAQNGWQGQIVPVLSFKRTELYLACNVGVPDALIAKMNAALRAMNSEGVSTAIERKYLPVGPLPH